jgi:hypothetical protein
MRKRQLPTPEYLSLYQTNTRVWLTGTSRKLARAAMLDDISDAELDRIAEIGFDRVELFSVWQTGVAGQRASRSNHESRAEFEETLADLQEEAITSYAIHQNLGDDTALLGCASDCTGRALNDSRRANFLWSAIGCPQHTSDVALKSNTPPIAHDGKV